MLYSQAYNIFPATPIQFGVGISNNLGTIMAQMGCRKVLVVTDTSILSLGILDDALQSISNAGLDYSIFSDTAPNAPLSSVTHAVETLQSGGFDTLLGAGGGSAMDIAKAARLFEAIPDAFTRCNLSAGGEYCPRQSKYKLITLPTLSGSGCEYMAGAVITNESNHEKETLAAADLQSDMAIIDPLLQVNVPVSITVASAIDSMCHAFNKVCAPGCEFQYRNVMAIDAIKAAWTSLPVIVHRDMHDIEARSALCYSSIMSGYIGGGPSGNFNHPVAHTISRFFPSVPHGIACAWALPATIRHMLPKCSAWTRDALALLSGVQADSETVASEIALAFIEWLKGVGINPPSKWSEPIDYDAWMDMAPFVKEDGTWNLNPFYSYPSDGEMADILREIYLDFD